MPTSIQVLDTTSITNHKIDIYDITRSHPIIISRLFLTLLISSTYPSRTSYWFERECEASLHDELVTNSDPVYQIEIELVLEYDVIMYVERTKYELSI